MTSDWDNDYLAGNPAGPAPASKNSFLDYLSNLSNLQNGAAPPQSSYSQGARGTVTHAPTPQPNSAAQGAMIKGAAAGAAGGGGMSGALSGALASL